MKIQKDNQVAIDNLAPVSEYSRIMGIDLTARVRESRVVWARFAVWFYIIEDCGAKLSDVANHFGWNHSTIIHGINEIKDKLKIGDSLACEQVIRIYRADPHRRYPIQKGRARAWLK